MRRADHLQCRRGRWSVRLRVPAHLVSTVGQTHLVRALDTSTEAVARQRRWIALALLWDWIGAQTVSEGWQPARAAALTGSGRSRDDTGRECPDQRLILSPKDNPKGWPRSCSSRGLIAPDHNAHDAGALVEGDRWVQTKQSRMQHALAVREFAQTQPSNYAVRGVDRRTAGEFVSDVLLRSRASQAMVHRQIAALSSMWQRLIKRGFVADNPWQGQGSFANGSSRSHRSAPTPLMSLSRSSRLILWRSWASGRGRCCSTSCGSAY